MDTSTYTDESELQPPVRDRMHFDYPYGNE
jgi:hypothetical protein